MLTILYAEEMNLWGNHNGAEEFATLTLEEQYTSYINSFNDVEDVQESWSPEDK